MKIPVTRPSKIGDFLISTKNIATPTELEGKTELVL
jgi:hypothetical protein